MSQTSLSWQQTDLSRDQRDRLLEAFTLFDEDGDGLIDAGDLGTVIRSLGQSPTLSEETDMVTEAAQVQCGSGQIDFETFLNVVSKRLKNVDHENELRESFRRFDLEDTGIISKEFLKNLLTTVGEPLTEEEVDEWFEDGNEFFDDEHLRYQDFASFMLSK